MPALLQSRANEIYNTTCAACHGITNQPGPSARALFATDFLGSRTDAQIVQITDRRAAQYAQSQLQDPVLSR